MLGVGISLAAAAQRANTGSVGGGVVLPPVPEELEVVADTINTDGAWTAAVNALGSPDALVASVAEPLVGARDTVIEMAYSVPGFESIESVVLDVYFKITGRRADEFVEIIQVLDGGAERLLHRAEADVDYLAEPLGLPVLPEVDNVNNFVLRVRAYLETSLLEKLVIELSAAILRITGVQSNA